MSPSPNCVDRSHPDSGLSLLPASESRRSMAFGLRAGVGTVGWALLRTVLIDRIPTQAYLYYPPPKAVDRWHSALEPGSGQ